MNKLYYLSQSDLDRVSRLTRAFEQGRMNPALDQTGRPKGAPVETYIGQTTTSLAALSGSTPGTGTAEAYQFNGTSLIDSGYSVQALNLSGQVIASGSWVTLTKDAYSGYYVAQPVQGASTCVPIMTACVSGTPTWSYFNLPMTWQQEEACSDSSLDMEMDLDDCCCGGGGQIVTCSCCPDGTNYQWNLSIEGITSCGYWPDCNLITGNFTLTYVEGCTWQSSYIYMNPSDPGGYGPVQDYWYYELACNNGYWYVFGISVPVDPIIPPSTALIYTTPVANFDCFNGGTIPGPPQTWPYCCNFPTTVTITP